MPKNKENFLSKHLQNEILDDIMGSPSMRAALQTLAQKNTTPLHSIQGQARNILKEMASAHNPTWVYTSRWVVKLIQKLLFGRFEIKGNLETLKSSDRPILYIPAHRSHMDYLFLSYVLLQNKLPPPIIAAGINLSFFPIGFIFRRLGAFFIRRRISGNATYKICLEHYLQWLVRNKQHIECYPEGGRSRDGMLRKPQSGLFQLVLQAMQSQNQPYDIVPVAIGYDFIPDAQGFASEEMGKDKESESIWTILKSVFHIRQHGNIYFHILPAIPVYSENLSGDIKSYSHSLLTDAFLKIQHSTPITSVQVLSCALLSTHKEFPEEYLYEQVMAIRDILSPYQNQFSQSLIQLENYFPAFIDQLVRKKWLISTTRYHYKIDPEQRIKMNYHRHSILHYFLPTYFAQSPQPEVLKKLWQEYFPYLSLDWLQPLHNTNAHTKWEGLDKMMCDILEPYFTGNAHPSQKTLVAHPRPENITPAKQQRAKNWLQQLDSDTLIQISNIN